MPAFWLSTLVAPTLNGEAEVALAEPLELTAGVQPALFCFAVQYVDAGAPHSTPRIRKSSIAASISESPPRSSATKRTRTALVGATKSATRNWCRYQPSCAACPVGSTISIGVQLEPPLFDTSTRSTSVLGLGPVSFESQRQ